MSTTNKPPFLFSFFLLRPYLKKCPELGLLPTDGERLEVIRALQIKQIKRGAPILLAGFVLMVVCSVVLGRGVFTTPPAPAVRFAVCGLIMLLTWLVLLVRLTRKPSVEVFLRRELCRRGFSVCLHCGYDLRGNTSGACPECGEKVQCEPDGRSSLGEQT